MPIKRRIGKAAKQLDNLDLEELFYGPGECLINGAGYIDGQLSRNLSEADLAAAREAMLRDWERHWRRVLEAWDSRSEHDLEIARRHHGNPAEPWAQREFGRPSQNEHSG